MCAWTDIYSEESGEWAIFYLILHQVEKSALMLYMINQWEETQLLTSSIAEGKYMGIQGHSLGEKNTFTMLY